ncbi:hypothetical protein TNCV_3120811, partial [Trichonephila clavipes]
MSRSMPRSSDYWPAAARPIAISHAIKETFARDGNKGSSNPGARINSRRIFT